jgi:hypothetical protein
MIQDIKFKFTMVVFVISAFLVILNVTTMIYAQNSDQTKSITSTPSFSQDITLVPPSDNYPEIDDAISAYANDTDWHIITMANVSNHSLQSIQLEIPNPFKGDGFLNNSVLPIPFVMDAPHTSIYRFQYINISSPAGLNVPFKYLEIDWNTAGLPDGPNDSFINPHYDFHFFTNTLNFINQEVTCISINITSVGRFCDDLKTGYDQMRSFLTLPPQKFMPSSYFPASGSSIAHMGLHNLDKSFDFTVQNVNNNPVIIYGTFGGKIVFLEASLTLFTFQNAMISDVPVRAEILQPESYFYEWWPNTVELEFDKSHDVFILSLKDFESHVIETNSK